MLTVRNKYDTFQKIFEICTPNDEYENLVTTHIEAAAECIPSNSRAKRRVPRASLVDREEWDNVKKTSLLNKRNSENANSKITNTYQKEQQECIQDQIDKIRNSINSFQSRLVKQIVIEVNKRKRILEAKLKAASQEERLQEPLELFWNNRQIFLKLLMDS